MEYGIRRRSLRLDRVVSVMPYYTPIKLQQQRLYCECPVNTRHHDLGLQVAADVS